MADRRCAQASRRERTIATNDRHLERIDHVIIAAHDLEAARAGYARLGFNSTPRGRHVGWGTANYCIMFEQDYIELLGIVDPAAFTNDLDRKLAAKGEGLLGLAAASSDADATAAAWCRAGLAADGPKDLGRLLEIEGGLDLAFKNVYLPASDTAGLAFFACHHLTPELTRRPAWLAHPNRATGLSSITIVMDDPAPLASAMGRIFGSAALTRTDNVMAVQTGGAVLVIAPPEDAMLMEPGLELEPPFAEPVAVLMSVTTADIAAAARFLELQNVPFTRRRDGTLFVAAGEAHGVAVEFEPA